jgi:hypothetical protein
MARVKANPAEKFESIEVNLSRNSNPIAYQAKLDELVEQGLYETVEEAEIDNPYFYIELEMYYDKHHGLYAVESAAIESNAESICSPYTGEYMEDCNEE